jgi:hypothetical protein
LADWVAKKLNDVDGHSRFDTDILSVYKVNIINLEE